MNETTDLGINLPNDDSELENNSLRIGELRRELETIKLERKQ